MIHMVVVIITFIIQTIKGKSTSPPERAKES